MEAHFQSLHGTLSQAETNFVIWEELRKALAKGELVRVMNSYSLFFLGTRNALFGSFVMLLYSVMEKRDETYNLGTLLKAVKAARPALDVKPWEAELGNLKPTWKKLSVLRHNVVSHVNAERTADEHFRQAALTPADVGLFIGNVQIFVKTLSQAARDTDMMFAQAHLHRVRFEQMIRRLGEGIRANLQ
jgi:hypothetical protein